MTRMINENANLNQTLDICHKLEILKYDEKI